MVFQTGGFVASLLSGGISDQIVKKVKLFIAIFRFCNVVLRYKCR